jgi:hypothetical protein
MSFAEIGLVFAVSLIPIAGIAYWFGHSFGYAAGKIVGWHRHGKFLKRLEGDGGDR